MLTWTRCARRYSVCWWKCARRDRVAKFLPTQRYSCKNFSILGLCGFLRFFFFFPPCRSTTVCFAVYRRFFTTILLYGHRNPPHCVTFVGLDNEFVFYKHNTASTFLYFIVAIAVFVRPGDRSKVFRAERADRAAFENVRHDADVLVRRR